MHQRGHGTRANRPARMYGTFLCLVLAAAIASGCSKDMSRSQEESQFRQKIRHYQAATLLVRTARQEADLYEEIREWITQKAQGNIKYQFHVIDRNTLEPYEPWDYRRVPGDCRLVFHFLWIDRSTGKMWGLGALNFPPLSRENIRILSPLSMRDPGNP